jgi:epsilon-lactone hydrolase
MSWQAHVVNGLLRVLSAPSRGMSEDKRLAQIFKAQAKRPPTGPTSKQAQGMAVESSLVNGMPVYELAPSVAAPDNHIINLHGGSYTFEMAGLQWSFVCKIAKAADARLTVPLYHVAPGSTARETVPAVTDIVERVMAESKSSNITLMGDSAGGGMALAVAQQLRDRGKQPTRILLIAPWLDVTMTDPKVAEIAPHDRLLTIDGLVQCGRLYAGDLDPSDPLASPINGSLKGLAPIEVFVGTHDMLYADSLRLAERAAAEGVQLRLVEKQGMQHVYPELPLLPEAREAQALIAKIVRGAT